MASLLASRKQNRANTISLEQTLGQRQPPTPSAQFLDAEFSQSHIRPNADMTHEPKDSPDKLLIKFLRSNETYEVEQPSDPSEARKTSQGVLREILGDRRWTRHMVEDFYREINSSVKGLSSCLTPYPFQRALYLLLLIPLEDNEKLINGRENAGRRAVGSSQNELTTLEDRVRERIAQKHAD